QQWFRKFRSGDFHFADRKGRGRLSELDDDELRALMEANTRTTVRVLAEHL
ncbi:hypothetical protein Angca_003542, partial [Angiostrongylus cantonensis]